MYLAIGKTKIILLFIALITSLGVYNTTYAQDFPLPKDFVFNPHVDMNQYTKYVVPCVNWLAETPLDEYKKERARTNYFVMNWLQMNPDMQISLPDYSLKFSGINKDLLYLFMEGWIKYTLETKDTNVTNCSVAGIKTMLQYYKDGKAASVGRSDYLDNLAKIEKDGALYNLFDTARTARNTYIYLTVPSPKHQFKYDENYFGFKFYNINLIRPASMTYRYMLDGYYDKWITTTDGSVTYPRLPPGNYTFRVQASMYPDFEHAAESNYSFSISRPVWKENWFLSVMGIVVISLVYFIIKQREKNLRNIAQLKHERIMFEYEHLKSQVNPHFLFNSLNTLNNLIAKDQKKAIAYTENLSELYHSILAHHENDLVLLSEEISILENYFSIQKGRFGAALQLRMNVSPTIMQSRKIVPLALQIVIENVIKHNIISESEPLVIDISANEEEITIRNFLNPKLSKEKSEGLGLINISRRYELLTKKPVTYGFYEKEYIVTLPLL